MQLSSSVKIVVLDEIAQHRTEPIFFQHGIQPINTKSKILTGNCNNNKIDAIK